MAIIRVHHPGQLQTSGTYTGIILSDALYEDDCATLFRFMEGEQYVNLATVWFLMSVITFLHGAGNERTTMFLAHFYNMYIGSNNIQVDSIQTVVDYPHFIETGVLEIMLDQGKYDDLMELVRGGAISRFMVIMYLMFHDMYYLISDGTLNI